jgi:NADH-quinone oxidoreductase subunit F
MTKKIMEVTDLERLREAGLKSIYPDKTKITVGMATCGLASGAQKVFDAIVEQVDSKRLDVIIARTGCLGFCQKEPLVDVLVPGRPRIVYAEMTPEKARAVITELAEGRSNKDFALCKMEEEEYLIEGKKRRHSVDKLSEDLEPIPLYEEIPFFRKQLKIVLRNCGFIDPENIEEYIARGGYHSLYKVLTELTPEQVIEEISRSGLRGRGGAGFPTGRKWAFCRAAQGEPKYVICNADEGDPGAYMNRSTLEGDPYSILEGMTIGAYAIGASEGYVYVRTEYPLAIEKLRLAVTQAAEYGLLGKDIFNSGFDFRVKITEGSGAFVCGEETALMASIEGRNPEPRIRPPFPAQSGLWGKPTNINNVGTWANVPVIIARGADWYSKIGTERSKGTKVFSVVGKINNTGLVEVPMGITLREIIYDIGGGILNGKRFKAVQTGGPSGGCIPSNLIDLPVDYEHLEEIGSIMGSGGMVVMDEDTCVVDLAKFFIDFTRSESCGRCNSCREGLDALHEILTRISNGEGKEGDLELLEDLSRAIKDFSLCGLGQTAPNPVLSTIHHFRDEYEAHIKYKRCPALVCKGIISSPCQYTCPIHQDVPCYIGLIAKGQFEEAIQIIRKENPLPGICGRVCTHPCETACEQGKVGEPVSIRSLKRFTADYELSVGREKATPIERTKEDKVAIIGSGPVGLACAYDLIRQGYPVTVFEAAPQAGGLLRYGIPEYRLPKRVVDNEISYIEELGVEIRTNTPVKNLEDVFNQNYKAVFLATGAGASRKMAIPNEDTKGVIHALDFLKQVNSGVKVELGERVAVIGGGNAAVDAARVAQRLGAKDITIIYRRSRSEMPAIAGEVDEAEREGVKLHILAVPVRVLTKNARLTGIQCIRMELGEPDASGRRRPIPIEGSKFNMGVDNVIIAIGQAVDKAVLPKELEYTSWGTLSVDPVTLQTKIEGVFAGGDVVAGPANVISAIAAGKEAAKAIDSYLQGKRYEKEYKVIAPAIYVEPVELSEEEIKKLERPEMPRLPITARIGNFREVESGLTQEMAIMEAKRCLRCDLGRSE